MAQTGYAIRVRGTVQGVGFRPRVWQLAHQLGLAGRVRNDSAGVLIELQADQVDCAAFIKQLRQNLPPLARLESLTCVEVALPALTGFTIIASEAGAVQTGCAADAVTCSHCLAELRDPDNRRYRYPFINCTHCGPRLSIIHAIPYDRVNTSMSGFTQCAACQAEYDDPADRRFHAQPNACAECGPQLWLETATGERVEVADPIGHLQQQLKAGAIIALRGLGGFQLVCDATNADAVSRLRARKFRPTKPFALMVRDPDCLTPLVVRSPAADRLLQSSAGPVVLLDRQADCELPDVVAPGQRQLGLMLPTTPLHHLLLEPFQTPLVMTSGNLSGMPQATGNYEAREQLREIADLLVLHDREIINRVDDSVVRQSEAGLQTLRRGRGYAPAPLPLPPGFEQAPDLLALGGELKNSICLLQAGRAVLSQYVGDLEEAATYDSWLAVLAHYQQLYQHQPVALVRDRHPEYLSSKYAVTRQEQGEAVVEVQHHHAHIAACLAEHDYPLAGPPVLGVCLDGTGFGEDGTLWGGELLRVDYRSSVRCGHLKPVALIGGSQAIREPWRNLFAQLAAQVDDAGWAQRWPALAGKPLPVLRAMLQKQLNSPLSSSAGRLFDAVAAALGCHADLISYEGEAAIALEQLAAQSAPVTGYPFAQTPIGPQTVLDPTPMWQALLADLAAGRPAAEIALAFHIGLADQLAMLGSQIARTEGLETVVLSGGVTQNGILLQRLIAQFQHNGLRVLWPQQIPANDGGLALGQALVAAAQLIEAGDQP